MRIDAVCQCDNRFSAGVFRCCIDIEKDGCVPRVLQTVCISKDVLALHATAHQLAKHPYTLSCVCHHYTCTNIASLHNVYSILGMTHGLAYRAPLTVFHGRLLGQGQGQGRLQQQPQEAAPCSPGGTLVGGQQQGLLGAGSALETLKSLPLRCSLAAVLPASSLQTYDLNVISCCNIRINLSNRRTQWCNCCSWIS